jgi:lysophospholipase L1-like esterase
VVFVGSSSIKHWDLKTHFPNQNVINRGFGGAKTSDVVFYADRIITKYEPKAVVVYVGGNDIGARIKETRKSVETVFKDFKTLCAHIHAKQKHIPILIISIKPSIKKWQFWPKIQEVNKLIKMHTDKTPLVHYVDIVPLMLGKDGHPNTDLFIEDGGHLNETAYQAWATVLAPFLKPILQTQ